MGQVSLYGDSNRRASFNRFVGTLGNFTWSQSKLVVEKVAQNSSNSYTFDVSINSQSAARPNQILLAQADLFVVTDYSFYIDGRTTANQGNIVYNSYPNPDIHTLTGATTVDLYAFFNAKYSIKVDNIIYVPQNNTSDFLAIPITQDVVSAAGPLSSGAAPSSPNGLFTRESTPNIFFSGKRTNQITTQLNLNAGGSAVAATSATYEVVFSFVANGFLVSGAADQWEALNKLQPYSI